MVDAMRVKQGRHGDCYLVEMPPAQLEEVRRAIGGGDAVHGAIYISTDGQKGYVRDAEPEVLVDTCGNDVIGKTRWCQHRRVSYRKQNAWGHMEGL